MTKNTLYSKRWREKHRLKARRNTYRCVARMFYRKYANNNDYKNIISYAKERLNKEVN